MPTSTGLPSPQDAPIVTDMTGRKLFVTSDTDTEAEGNIDPLNLPTPTATQAALDAVTNASGSWSATKDAVIVLVAGQSNALGVYGSNPTTLANVKTMQAGERDWSSWSQDCNVAVSGLTAKSPAGAIAQDWQIRIDGGATLPDLYILTVAKSGQGVTRYTTANNNQWHPARNIANGSGVDAEKWNHAVSGIVDSNVSLYGLAHEALIQGVNEIHKSGKRPVFLGALWVGGEADSKSPSAADDYFAGITQISDSIRGVLGVPANFFVSRMVREASSNYTELAASEAAWESLMPDNKMISLMDSPLWDASDSQKGIYGGDGLHYSSDAQDWLGEEFLIQTLDASDQGNTVQPISETRGKTSFPLNIGLATFSATGASASAGIVSHQIRTRTGTASGGIGLAEIADVVSYSASGQGSDFGARPITLDCLVRLPDLVSSRPETEVYIHLAANYVLASVVPPSASVDGYAAKLFISGGVPCVQLLSSDGTTLASGTITALPQGESKLWQIVRIKINGDRMSFYFIDIGNPNDPILLDTLTHPTKNHSMPNGFWSIDFYSRNAAASTQASAYIRSAVITHGE